MLRKRLSAIMAALLLLSSAGCVQQKDDEVKTVGLAMPSKALERWNRDGEYLKQVFESEGYNVELKYSDNNIDQQINDLQVLIADDVDVLIVAAVDGATLFRTLEDAKIKNIPVIAYDRLILNTDTVDCYISFDNFKVGELQAQFILDSLSPDTSDRPLNIELVSGDTADNNARFFYNGFMSVMEPYLESGRFVIPSNKITFEQTATPQWSTVKAYENMQNTLASYYAGGTPLDAVHCASDCLTVGVTQAIASDYTGKTPVVTGQDGDIAALRDIVEGQQSMTIYKNVRDEANVTVEVAKAILGEEDIDEELIEEFEVPCAFDTDSYDNGVKKVPSYLLTPNVITLENLDLLTEIGPYEWDKDHRYLVEK